MGPDYKGPPTVAARSAAAARFHRAGETEAASPPSRWWAALGDPELDSLIETALKASPELAAAEARLRQSRAGLRQNRAKLLPSTSVADLALDMKGMSPGGGDLHFYDVGFDATWEIDLFGGQRRAIEGASAQAQASLADLEGARVSLEAEVAKAYVALRDLQQRLAIGRRSAEVEARLVALAQQRQAGGTTTALDVERLNTQLQSTRASLVPLRAQVTDQLDRLAVLTGREPGALDAELSPSAPLPTPPAQVAVGDPASLLRRRPDVRAAERRLAQHTAVIGQRTADLFPKVQLLGTLGFGSTDLGQLFTGQSYTYAAAPVLQWSPFDFGRTQARISQAKAERDEALAIYRKTVLSALQDAESGLSRYGRQRESVERLTDVARSADRAWELMDLKVRGGAATTLDQLDVERQRLNAEMSLAQARAELTQDYIALQKSLGLGWSSSVQL